MDKTAFKQMFLQMMQNKDNPYHPMVWINGNPEIGAETRIGGFSEINAIGARVVIGEWCDIGSFVSINCSDSHNRALGLIEEIDRQDIIIGNHVFVGSHCVILGGSVVGHHSVIGAGTVVREGVIPPFSLVLGNPMVVKAGYYRKKLPKLAAD